jgi:menaquinone-9 beta-reductase
MYDIVVVGAGPAGSTCAYFLGKMGHKVLLVDKAKFPRDKTCGDGITGKSSSILNDMGLIDTVARHEHAKVTGALISSPNGHVAEILSRSHLPDTEGIARTKKSLPNYACRRFVYDNILFQHAKSNENVEVWEEFIVTDLIKEKGFLAGIKGIDKEKNEKEVRSKVVVGSDGALSIVRRKLGYKDLEEKHTMVGIRTYYRNIKGVKDEYEFHLLSNLIPGYFWIFPLENGLCNVGIAIILEDKNKKNMNVKEVLESVIKSNPMFADRFKNAEAVGDVKGWILPLGSNDLKMHGDGYILIGDAASIIDPLTGEGIGNAMWSAKLAAQTIDNAIKKNDFSEKTLKEYKKKFDKGMRKELRTTYFFQKILRHKRLVNFIIGKASNKEIINKLWDMVYQGPKFPLLQLKVMKILMS